MTDEDGWSGWWVRRADAVSRMLLGLAARDDSVSGPAAWDLLVLASEWRGQIEQAADAGCGRAAENFMIESVADGKRFVRGVLDADEEEATSGIDALSVNAERQAVLLSERVPSFSKTVFLPLLKEDIALFGESAIALAARDRDEFAVLARRRRKNARKMDLWTRAIL